MSAVGARRPGRAAAKLTGRSTLTRAVAQPLSPEEGHLP